MLEAEKKGSTVEMKLAKITNEVKKHLMETTNRFEDIQILELMISYFDDAMPVIFSQNCFAVQPWYQSNDSMIKTNYFD